MEQRISIERLEQAVNIFGSFDENIRLLEREFSVTVVNRDGELRVDGEPEEHTVLSLIFGTRRGKICGNSSYSLADCDKIIKRTQLRLFWLPLPVTVERETIRCRAAERVPVAPETAEKRCEAALTEYLTALVADHGSVRSTLCTARQAGDVLTVTLTAECEEQIGERVPIYTETAVKTP